MHAFQIRLGCVQGRGGEGRGGVEAGRGGSGGDRTVRVRTRFVADGCDDMLQFIGFLLCPPGLVLGEVTGGLDVVRGVN